MPDNNYNLLQISPSKAETITLELYGIKGTASPLPGELDMNFRIESQNESYILKISRPDIDDQYIDFQQKILEYLEKEGETILSPRIIKNISKKSLSYITDDHDNVRKVRLYSWIDGRLWSSVNPQSDSLLSSLGQQAAKLSMALEGFDHPYAHRDFEWDISNALWIQDYFKLFEKTKRCIAETHLARFIELLPQLKDLCHAVVHNDVNDNNIIVSEDILDPEVRAIIDFGDAIHTSIINDLAITIAYAIMNKPDPLSAAILIISAYHRVLPIKEDELALLYNLVAMRLLISVTKSAINKEKEPENEYLIISEIPAWELLYKWSEIIENFAHYNFRQACGFDAHPNYSVFEDWARNNLLEIESLFPESGKDTIHEIDLGIGSSLPGHNSTYGNINHFTKNVQAIQDQVPDKIIAGGYHEIRPIYSTEQYAEEGNQGPEYRAMHLGIDFWVDEGMTLHAPLDGEVFSFFNNSEDKDYGPTLILKHKYNKNKTFYTLYGHLGMPGFDVIREGQKVEKGDFIGFIGGPHENGGWPPHLHFQIILDILGNETNFPGVARPGQKSIWKQLCPDPGLLFNLSGMDKNPTHETNDSYIDRKKYLGKSLSLSYDNPLEILRGDGVFLIDNTGRKYLDTVNNVAHVGHEHHRIVKAGQDQMAILNTNTRYLHPIIIEFAKNLLSTFPDKLSVVHFVNSGSEANELALRMAKTYTGQKDIIAVEAGYHGNTGACIDISSYKFDGRGGSGAPEHTHIVPLPDTYRGIYQGNETGSLYASHVQEKIDEIRSKGRDVAAFICESIISCGGQIELPADYLKTACKMIHQAGGICIADEVQVGCGRVGSAFWGFQLHEVSPDIVCIGKPIGNGHPLAAVVCTPEIAEAFNNGMEYFNTFGGNPVSCAIGNEVLNVVFEEKLQENALRTGIYLKRKLNELKSKYPIIGDVRGQGLFLGFELNGKDKKPLGDHAGYLANRMKELAVLMSTDGPDYNVLKIKPPLVFTIENADELLKRLHQVLQEDYMNTYE